MYTPFGRASTRLTPFFICLDDVVQAVWHLVGPDPLPEVRRKNMFQTFYNTRS